MAMVDSADLHRPAAEVAVVHRAACSTARSLTPPSVGQHVNDGFWRAAEIARCRQSGPAGTVPTLCVVSEEFDAAVERYRGNLASIVDAGRLLRESRGYLPDAESEAMREIAEEERYRHNWAQKPVDSSHSWAGVLLTAAEDHCKSICRLVIGEASLFGLQSLARAGLEAAGRAEWFTESGIGTGRRVARYQTERLHNIYQLTSLTSTPTGSTSTSCEAP